MTGVRWRRAWPGGTPGEALPDRWLALEGVDGRGEVVAATRRPGAAERPVLHDERLPALAEERAAGARLLAHRAGKRAVLRRPDAFVKVATPRATRTALARLSTLADALPAHPDAPALVRVLAADPDRGVLHLHPAPGTALTDVLAAGDPHRARAAAARTGDAVAVLARTPARDLPEHPLTAEADVLRRWVDDAVAFAVLPPTVLARLRAVTADLDHRLRTAGPLAPVTSHRDLHDGQVLLGERTTFLDVDTAALADPAQDPGNLLAHLDLAAVTGTCPPRVAAAAADGFLAALRERAHPAAQPCAAARLDLLRAATRARLVAVHGFRGLAPGHALELLGE